MTREARSDDAVAALAGLLDVAPIASDTYRGASSAGDAGRVFGGQVIGQALAAAARSVPATHAAHSLHAYFMRPGDAALPIEYRVLPDFDGRSFSTRRVVAVQHDRPILNLTASFQRPEHGLEHGVAMPAAATPEVLQRGNGRRSGWSVASRFASRFDAFEFLPVPPYDDADARPGAGPHRLWFRLTGPAPEASAMRQALLAYISDIGLLGTTLLPHGRTLHDGTIRFASLDHSLWLHEVPRLDGWLLYTFESPWAGGGRGLARGMIHTAAGRHVASVAQEGLIRPVAAPHGAAAR